MRGLRNFTIALLVAGLSVPLFASSAMANSFDTDHDDTPASFDIRSVRSWIYTGPDIILFRSRFYDELQWTRRTSVWVYIDSRSGPSYDFLLATSVRHDVAHCDLYSVHALVGRGKVNVGPSRVTCRVKRRLLRPTRPFWHIRYKVRAISRAGGEQVNDWAPGGFGNWYPHV
jgi:hypothetical protein